MNFVAVVFPFMESLPLDCYYFYFLTTLPEMLILMSLRNMVVQCLFRLGIAEAPRYRFSRHQFLRVILSNDTVYTDRKSSNMYLTVASVKCPYFLPAHRKLACE